MKNNSNIDITYLQSDFNFDITQIILVLIKGLQDL